MIKTVLDRDEMRKVAPGLVRECEMDLAPDAPMPSYVLAWAVGPGGQTVPGPGETDADQVRAWAERAITFQARGYRPGGKGTYRNPNRGFVIPDAVVDHIFALTKSEYDLDPHVPTLMPRVCKAISEGREAPEPPAPELPAPRPRF